VVNTERDRGAPNGENIGTHDLLGVGQAIDATPYRGRSLAVSGWMAAEGDAKANLAVYVMTESIQAIGADDSCSCSCALLYWVESGIGLSILNPIRRFL
jgi:hypothetical protein